MDYLRAYAESDDENCTESRRIAGGASCETLSALKRKRINDESNDQSTLHKTRRTRRETACATRYLDIEAAIGEGSEGESDEGEGDEDAGFVDDSLAGFDLTDPRSVAWEEEEDVVREAEELIRIEAEKLIQRAQRDDGRGRHASETRTARERECENERMRRGQRKEVRARQERESERARRVHGGPPRRAAGRIGNAEETLEEQVEEYFLTIAERDHSKFRKRFEWGRLRRAIGRARSRQLVLVESARSVLMIVPDGPKGGRLERFHIKLGHRLEDVLHPEDEPTREEIALWDGVDKLIPQAASNPRAGMALGPGCRVSFKSLDTEERDKNGFITEMKEDNRVARVRISVDGETILQSDPRLYELLTFPTAKAATNKIEEIEVPVVDLRRHLLCVPCHLRHFDRVRVVGSRASAVGVRGRVCAIESSGDDPQVTLVTEEGKDIEVAMSEVIREFMLGDLVDVVAGPVAGERGIIVDMLLGGGLQLFATSSAAVNRSVQVLDSLLSDYEALADLKLDVDTDGKVANTLGLLHVVAEQVEFAQADCRPGGWSLPSTTKPAHQARALSEYDKSRQEKTMHTGRGRYKHEEVLIISPHPMKGQWGVVLDEHDIVSATDFTKAEGDPTVVLTVRGEMSLKTWQVPLDQVVHRWTRLSLDKSTYITPWAGPLGWEGGEEEMAHTPMHTYSPGEPASMDAAWILSPPPTPAHVESPTPNTDDLLQLGSDGGRWLCIPGLKGKRVDVGVLKKKGQCAEAHSAAVGKCSYIELEEALTPEMMNKRITIRAGDKAKKLRLEPRWLVPWRTLPAVNGRVMSIVDGRGRVVIIGPDHLGNTEFLGRYGLTGASAGVGWVWVKLERAKDTAATQSLFHEQSLCRSLNEDGVWTKATVFM